jgi:hypothetical protein
LSARLGDRTMFRWNISLPSSRPNSKPSTRSAHTIAEQSNSQTISAFTQVPTAMYIGQPSCLLTDFHSSRGPWVPTAIGWGAGGPGFGSWKVQGSILHSVMTGIPPLWSSGQSSWLPTQRSRARFLALPDCLSSSGSGTGSTQPL